MADTRIDEVTADLQKPLTGLQLELLKLYSTEMTTGELLELKQHLGQYFADKAARRAGEIWQERGYSDEDMDSWLHD